MSGSKVQKFFESSEIVSEYLSIDTPDEETFPSLARVPFNKYRMQLLASEIETRSSEQDTLFEIGCGTGLLSLCLQSGHRDVHALDISAEMVAQTRALFEKHGFEGDRISQGDLFEFETKERYRHVVANGVICYYRDQERFLKKVHQLLDDGYAFISHRNDLFNLFALNAGTGELFERTFLSAMPDSDRELLQNSLSQELPGLKQQVQKASNASLYRSAENPLTVSEVYQQAGLVVEEVLWTFIHPYPPRVECAVSAELFRDLQFSLARDWRGMFMGSQFIVIARKA